MRRGGAMGWSRRGLCASGGSEGCRARERGMYRFGSGSFREEDSGLVEHIHFLSSEAIGVSAYLGKRT